MNYFIDGRSFERGYQGTYVYLEGLYNEFIKKNENIVFFIGVKDKRNIPESIRVHRNVKPLVYILKCRIFQLLLEIPFRIVRKRCRYAHFQYVCPPIKTCRYIVTIHDVLFNDFPQFFSVKYRFIRNILFRLSAIISDFVLTVSESASGSILKHYKISSKKMVITYNGFNEEFARTQNIKSMKRRYILYVSRFEPRKNHLMLVKAYVNLMLYKKGIFLYLIGEVTDRTTAVLSYLNQLPNDIRRYIIHQRAVPLDQMVEYYRNAMVFVYPSFAEGFGIPQVEAIASKTPILISENVIIPQLKNFPSIRFSPHDMKELEDKLARILEEPYTIDDSLRNEILRVYSWKKISDNFHISLFGQN